MTICAHNDRLQWGCVVAGKELHRMRGVAVGTRQGVRLHHETRRLVSRLLDSSTAEFTEQSENVYENKGSVQKSTTPSPFLSKDELAGWDFAAFATFAAWRETGFVMRKTTEQSENVYENKGRCQNVKESRSQGVEKSSGAELYPTPGPGCSRGRRVGSSTPRLSTLDSQLSLRPIRECYRKQRVGAVGK